MKKAIFQLHWLAGITIGAVLGFSGLTGALLAFGPELSQYLHGGFARVEGRGATALPVSELYQRVHAAYPSRSITDLVTYADSALPARVRFEVPTYLGPAAPIPETHLVDPYTGALLPVRPAGPRIERFMSWLHEVHQGHWGGPRDTAAVIGATAVGYGAVALGVMALSGLYLRWPRGLRAGSWRSWLAVDTRLRGRAFLWNLHAVAGTLALAAFLVSAHSGAFQSGRVLWYANGARAVLGLQPIGHRPPPGTSMAPPGGGPLPLPAGAPAAGAPPPPGPRMDRPTLIAFQAGGYFDADGDAINARKYQVEPGTGEVAEIRPRTRAFGVGGWIEANNQVLHEGRLFGRAGTAVMAIASLALPGFYVTGWLMYLKRRAKRAPRS